MTPNEASFLFFKGFILKGLFFRRMEIWIEHCGCIFYFRNENPALIQRMPYLRLSLLIMTWGWQPNWKLFFVVRIIHATNWIKHNTFFIIFFPPISSWTTWNDQIMTLQIIPLEIHIVHNVCCVGIYTLQDVFQHYLEKVIMHFHFKGNQFCTEMMKNIWQNIWSHRYNLCLNILI